MPKKPTEFDNVRKGLKEIAENVSDLQTFAPPAGGETGAGASRTAPPADLDPGQFARAAIRDALRWRVRGGDTPGFVAALQESFDARRAEGRVEYVWRPRSFTLQADLGAITGPQAVIAAHARSVRDSALELLDAHEPLKPCADEEEVDALRKLLRWDVEELVQELSMPGGPLAVRIEAKFDRLLGPSDAAATEAALRRAEELIRDIPGLVAQINDHAVSGPAWTFAGRSAEVVASVRASLASEEKTVAEEMLTRARGERDDARTAGAKAKEARSRDPRSDRRGESRALKSLCAGVMPTVIKSLTNAIDLARSVAAARPPERRGSGAAAGGDRPIAPPRTLLGRWRRALGFEARHAITVEEETVLSKYLMFADLLRSLRQTWDEHKAALTPVTGAYLGTQLVHLSRVLDVIVESVDELEAALDRVYVGAAQRQVTQLSSGGKPLFLGQLLDWVRNFATQEGLRQLQDAGKPGARQFAAVASELAGHLRGGLLAGPHTVPAGVERPGVQRAVRDLIAVVETAQRLAEAVTES